jgi:hypothetical protein
MTAKSDDAIRVWPIAGVAMAVLGGLLLVVAAFFLAAVVSDQQYSLAEQRVVAGGRGLNAMSGFDWLVTVVVAGLGLLSFLGARANGFGRRVSPSEIRAGLTSPDQAVRLKSTDRLAWLSGSEASPLAYAMLTDGVPKIRGTAMNALHKSPGGHRMLVHLLAQDNQELERRENVLGGLDLRMVPVLSGAVREAETPEIRRDLLLRMERLGTNMPWLESPRTGVVGWPNRCCVCGKPAPTSTGVLSGVTSVYDQVKLSIPLCQFCKSARKPMPGFKIAIDSLRIRLKSAEFAADLLESTRWTTV